jgi:predicted RNA binding protein YcfA (HicA-like mRNA interferase family)
VKIKRGVRLSKRAKRLKKLRQNPKNVSLEQLQLVLEDYGFWLDRVVGSHHIFRAELHTRNWKLSIPFNRPIKIIYVTQALEAIDQIILEAAIKEDDDGNSED